MAIEYITSKNLFFLIYETLELLDGQLVKHGARVSYIMAKMLECKGGYEKYEIADFMLLAMLHDIGAYKTDDVRKQLSFEAKNPLPHSVYGYLFLKYLSPFELQSKMILYHHVGTSHTETIPYKYKNEAEMLKVAEIMDIWQRTLGDDFEPQMIERYIGTKYQKMACSLLLEAAEKYDIFQKLKDGSFKEEYEENLEYLLFSDEEKWQYLKMLMYCTGFRDESMVANTIATVHVAREIAKRMQLSELDKKEIYYAALLHDIGMLAMPPQLTQAPRKLEEEERNLIHTHVDITSRILNGRIPQSIIDITAAHHERFDGSGYPRGLKGSVMNDKQAILQIAELAVSMSSDKPYRKAYTKEDIVKNMNDGIVSGKYDGVVTDTFLRHYDEIMGKAIQKAETSLQMFQKLKKHSEQGYKNL